MVEKELEEILDNERILNDPVILKEYSCDISFAPSVEPRLVVKPRNAEDVQKIIKWANVAQVDLIPVSSGPPHFRGDTVPGVAGSIIVDLSEMKKIIRQSTLLTKMAPHYLFANRNTCQLLFAAIGLGKPLHTLRISIMKEKWMWLGVKNSFPL